MRWDAGPEASCDAVTLHIAREDLASELWGSMENEDLSPPGAQPILIGPALLPSRFHPLYILGGGSE